MKICILVNGEKDGIFARRAEQFLRYTPSLKNATILCRNNSCKIFAIFYFAFNLIRIRPQLVYVEAVALSGCLATVLLKPILRFKNIVSTGDDYCHIIKQLHGPIFGFLAGILEYSIYKTADMVISLSPYQKDYLTSIGYKNVSCVNQGVDTDLFKPINVDELKRKLRLNGFLIIGLAGSIVWYEKYGYSYGWEIIEVLRILKEKPVKGLIAGDGNGLSRLKKLAQSYGILDKIIFTGRLPYEAMPFYINCMDVCFSTQSNNIVGRMRTPTKLGEYLACGKFVISSDVGYAQLILKDIGALISYKGIKDDSYPDKAAKIIEDVLSDKSILDKAKGGINIAREKFDFKNLSNQLERIIINL